MEGAEFTIDALEALERFVFKWEIEYSAGEGYIARSYREGRVEHVTAGSSVESAIQRLAGFYA